MKRRSLKILATAIVGLALPAMHAQVYQPATCRNAYTQQQEIAEGEKVVSEVYRTMPVLPDEDPTSQFISRLGARLVAVAPPTPGLEQRWPFRFHVVASEEINAFALPGGTMFVNLGAIRAAETEAQLAGVMSHELSHVILRHSTCNISKQRKEALGAGVLGAIAQIALGGRAGTLASTAISAGTGLHFLSMSRGDEQQADLLGVQIAHDAGYDPRGLPQFFEIIQAKYGKGSAQWLSDHPNPGNRTAYVNAEIAQLAPLQNPIKSTGAFAAAHARAGGQRVFTSKEMQGGAWRSTGLYASRPGGRAEIAYPVAGGADTTTGANGHVGPAIAPLSTSQLGLRDSFGTLQMPRYTLSAPRSWVTSDRQGDSVTMSPPGGAGEFGVAYGALLGITSGNGQVRSADDLQRASDGMLQKLMNGGGLTQISDWQHFTKGGAPGMAVVLRGISPAGEGGQPLPERDWLMTIARPDGDVAYLVFVAPERDFSTMQPTFENILRSLQFQQASRY